MLYHIYLFTPSLFSILQSFFSLDTASEPIQSSEVDKVFSLA